MAKAKKNIKQKKRKKSSVKETAVQEKQISTSPSANIKLIFPPGSPEGFTNVATSQFIKDPSSCVRELIQNSSDAALIDIKRDKAKISFCIEQYPKSKIPGIAEHENALDSAKKRQNNEQSINVCEKFEEYLTKDNMAVLFISDNGIGLDKEKLAALLSDGISLKGNEGSSGSFGNGHFTTFVLSSLHYIFYAGITEKDGMIFSGHAMLASHIGKYKGEKKALGKNGYYVKNINDKDLGAEMFEFGGEKDIPELLKHKMEKIKKEWGTGTLVAVPAFNNFDKKNKDNKDIILIESALNFFYAIKNNSIDIEVVENNQVHKLDIKKLDEVMDAEKEQKRGRRNFPSGYKAWNAYETLKKGREYTINTSFGNIKMYLRQNTDDKKITLCRNGMWISDNITKLRKSDFGSRVNFNALLQVDSKDSGDAHGLLKVAETPLHNEINPKLINNNEKRKKLYSLLEEIQKEIMKYVEEKDEDEFSPADIFPVEVSGPATGKNQGLGNPEKIGSGASGDGKGKKGKKRKKKISKPSAGSYLGAKISSKMLDNNKLSVYLKADEDCPNAEIRFSLDGGADITCNAGINAIAYIKTIDVKTPNGTLVKNITDDKGIYAAQIGELKQGDIYHLEVEYDLPEKISGKHALIVDLTRRKKMM